MEIHNEDYEMLGKFYLGRTYDLAAKELQDDLVLYDSKDLVTHGVVLGMTGSGKTGLCITLLEEAAMDNIPSIVIDPKGDLSNLLLTFPDLAPKDFRDWINVDDAAKKGISPEEHAAKTAAMWKSGLESWGQDGDRIRSFQDKVDMAIYTPGSSAGLPVSILSSLDVPSPEILDDGEALNERIESTVSSLLSLVGNKADPIRDPEHILLSNIFSHSWKDNHGVTLETLIKDLRNPPFKKIGVMDLDTVCPQKSRLDLAMKMNNLLASPGFSSWLEGEPLDIKRMLHAPDKKPRISIFSIAHLSDTERMFFVSLLLNQMVGWMRTQTGTTSLRALLYMDEIYGYLPPSAMPPSKKPMMTMLKQGRAFGLGVLLATQNPVDLDYKALSNIGTWWLGRLQTERDKARVLDGLEGAAASNNGNFDRRKMEQLLAGLGERVFLMNNVHDDAPVVFHVRWVMSYLAGPLARTQIKTLMDPKREEIAAAKAAAPDPEAPKPKPRRPSFPKDVREYFVPLREEGDNGEINYVPMIIRVGEVLYDDSKTKIKETETVVITNKLDKSSKNFRLCDDSSLPDDIKFESLAADPVEGASYDDIPNEMGDEKFWKDLKNELPEVLAKEESPLIFRSPSSNLFSKFRENELDFRNRLVEGGRESREQKESELKEKHKKVEDALNKKIESAKKNLAEQTAQSRGAWIETAMRIFTVLATYLMKKRFSSTSGRMAVTGASKISKEHGEASAAKRELDRLISESDSLSESQEDELEKLRSALDPKAEKFEEVMLKRAKSNCHAVEVGVLWRPHRTTSSPSLSKAW